MSHVAEVADEAHVVDELLLKRMSLKCCRKRMPHVAEVLPKSLMSTLKLKPLHCKVLAER